MPILRYFVFVGGALLALLLGIDLVLPGSAGTQSVASSGDFPPIRIHSDHRLPDRVVLDTSQPTIIPPVTKTAAAVAPRPPGQAASPGQTASQALAQLVPTEPKAGAKKANAKPQPRRRFARTRWAPPPPWDGPMVLAQQPHSGFFSMTW